MKSNPLFQPNDRGRKIMNYDSLLSKMLEFRNARNWEQFHDPKNLAIALSIEAGELMEHFLWVEKNQIANFDEDKLQAISEEIADVFIYLSYLAKGLDIDIEAAVIRKLVLNGLKYPAECSLPIG
jgi:NTP pyrophosphatase (non-canonical NTP hydrolase)